MRRVSYRSVGAHITPWLLPTVVLIIAIGMAWIEPRFYNRLNLMNIARNFAVAGVLGMAQALVMIGRLRPFGRRDHGVGVGAGCIDYGRCRSAVS
jgi:predicted ABC-type sugar transport system permease subunit